MKLRGRLRRPAAPKSNEAHRATPTAAVGDAGAHCPGARGAKHEAPHGPLQRLLEGTLDARIHSRVTRWSTDVGSYGCHSHHALELQPKSFK